MTTYDELIAKPENTTFASLVDKVINDKLEAKYTMLMDGGDVARLVPLSMRKAGEIGFAKKMFKTSRGPAYAAFTNVGKLYSTLSLDTQMSIIRSLGLEFIVATGLDDMEPYTGTLRAYASKHPQLPKKCDVYIAAWDTIKVNEDALTIVEKYCGDIHRDHVKRHKKLPRVLVRDVDEPVATKLIADLAKIGLVGRMEYR